MEILKQACVLITGIMASGKSSVAQNLAEQLPKSVHLRGDIFRKMLVNGRADIVPPLLEEAMAQLRLRYQLAAMVANRYCAEGFTVIYRDVIIGAFLDEVIDLYKDYPLYIVVLCPSPETVFQRDANRHKHTYGSWTPEALDRTLREETPHLGLWLDTSMLSVQETISSILEQLEQARISDRK